MKRILVGVVLLVALVAGGVMVWAQDVPSDPLAARILELQQAYENVVTQIVGVEEQLQDLKDQKLRLEGGIMELQRIQAQAQPPVGLTGIVVPETGAAPLEEPEEE
jgi:hypothetical protein